MRMFSPMRVISACLVSFFLLAGLSSEQASAEETWVVRSGHTFLHINTHLLKDLGVEIEDVTGNVPPPDDFRMETPNWTFPIDSASDLGFRTLAGVPVPGGVTGGAIRHQGSLAIVIPATGKRFAIDDLEIAYVDPKVYSPEDLAVFPSLYLRPGTAKSTLVCELHDSMFHFDRENRVLSIHYLNARISKPWAEEMGRPDLAGWVVGMAEVVAEADRVSATGVEPAPPQPDYDGGILDVSLGGLGSIQQAGHAGSFPTGTAGLTMSTTSCNLGQVDVPWLAPMQEDHPLIHMALYRLLDGRFEQIGVSWMKHGFYALSNSQCTPCQHPSNGSFLGVGCSDTYGPANNSDREYLGPRVEVNAYQKTWECTGSHFAGGQPDCVRRHGGGSGHGPVDHRLAVADADLNNANATYYYEAYYLVRGDQSLANNWGSRRCTMSWGGVWDFTTPSQNNGLLEGPAVGRWGDLQTTVKVAPDDGEVLLVVQATDLGGGRWHYEYALLNKDSEREIRSFSLPVVGVQGIANLGFHDSDLTAGNEWQVSLDGTTLTWATETFDENPNANSLVYGLMFNFRFDAEAPPSSVAATLGLFRPGFTATATATTTGPTNTTVAVAGGESSGPMVQLLRTRPNPFTRAVTIPVELASAESARLDIFDAAGRLVRTLTDGVLGAGAQDIAWDGKDSRGWQARSGVYYARLSAGGTVLVQPMVLVNN